MKIKKLTLDNFKGVRHAEYEFGDRTIIKSDNGLGKSTIATAWFWLISNYSYELVSNPNIRPNDAIDEIVTTVTADLDCGKPVQIQKIQKFKRSKSGTTSLTNSYMVNSVPKSEKQFKEAMSELGVDFDKFLQCSHPNVMLSGINNKKERDQLRNMLFQMASDITDLQVAESDPELFGITELLKNYKAEEIAAMQNNTLRKIRENYGKEGEILRAKIEGLESAKVEVDVKGINAKIDELNAKKDNINAQVKRYQNKLIGIQNVASEIMEKRFKLQQMESDAVKDEITRRSKLDTDIFKVESQIQKMKDDITRKNHSIGNDREIVEKYKALIETNRNALEAQKSRAFDESTAICPTCGQVLPPEGIENTRKLFEADKTERIERLEETIENTRNMANAGIERINTGVKEVRELSKQLNALEKDCEGMKVIRKDMGDAPTADMSNNQEYHKLLADITDYEDIVASAGVIQDEINTLKQKSKHTESRIQDQKLELEKVYQNKRIDEQIAEAREQQKNYEQQKANAEMIIDQLKTLNMKKNTMLQESVNKHFDIISWKLWDTQRNGEYKDACVPLINGLDYRDEQNTATQIFAKIDVLNGFQKFFNLDYPIILDYAESLSSKSLKKIKSNHQLIVLRVSDDERLVFE